MSFLFENLSLFIGLIVISIIILGLIVAHQVVNNIQKIYEENRKQTELLEQIRNIEQLRSNNQQQ